jgi:hypothetical protein
MYSQPPPAPRRLAYHPRASGAGTESDVHVLLGSSGWKMQYGVRYNNERTNPPFVLSHDDHCLTFHQAPLLAVYPFFYLFIPSPPSYSSSIYYCSWLLQLRLSSINYLLFFLDVPCLSLNSTLSFFSAIAIAYLFPYRYRNNRPSAWAGDETC